MFKSLYESVYATLDTLPVIVVLALIFGAFFAQVSAGMGLMILLDRFRKARKARKAAGPLEDPAERERANARRQALLTRIRAEQAEREALNA